MFEGREGGTTDIDIGASWDIAEVTDDEKRTRLKDFWANFCVAENKVSLWKTYCGELK